MPTHIAHIDQPNEANAVDRFAFFIVGWVWLGTDQHRIAAIEAWSGDSIIGETTSLGVRPDVCAHLGVDASARTAFEILGSQPAVARGMKLEVVIRARFADGTRTGRLAMRTVPSYGHDESPREDAGWPGDDEIRSREATADSLPLPPEHLQIRQVGSSWGPAFYREGRVILNQIARAYADSGKALADAQSILDFGCGSCRVLSALSDMPRRGEVWGSDIDAEAIEWNAANLGHLARFAAIPVLPPTRFADGQFDAIYSVSVFSHLPEDLQFVWLNELRRILRPGGVLVASVHGGQCYREADATVRSEVASRGFAYRAGQATPGLPDFYMLAFHGEHYLRTRWTRYFEFVALWEKHIHGLQDAVVLRRGD